MADDAYRKVVKRKGLNGFEQHPSVIVRSFEVAPGVYAEAAVIVGEDGKPVAMSGQPVAWQPVSDNVIRSEDTYQTLLAAGAAPHGGYIVNTSAPGSEPLWVDPTGATGGQRSAGAMPVYPAPDANSAPGGWRIPASVGAVTIMGPAGATFQAFFG